MQNQNFIPEVVHFKVKTGKATDSSTTEIDVAKFHGHQSQNLILWLKDFFQASEICYWNEEKSLLNLKILLADRPLQILTQMAPTTVADTIGLLKRHFVPRDGNVFEQFTCRGQNVDVPLVLVGGFEWEIALVQTGGHV